MMGILCKNRSQQKKKHLIRGWKFFFLKIDQDMANKSHSINIFIQPILAKAFFIAIFHRYTFLLRHISKFI